MLTFTGLTTIDDHGFRPEIFASLSSERSQTRPVSFKHSAPIPHVSAELVNPLITKLRRFASLDASDVEAVNAITAPAKLYLSGKTLFHEGSAPDYAYLFVQGMACRYKLLPSGQRQILGFLLPGDLCDVQFLTLSAPDHSVALLSDAQLVKIPARRIRELLAERPRIDRALAMAALLDFAILREWLLNVGQRNALEKLAHFFCEMQFRLESGGQVDEDGSFELPVNQSTLADTTGLTPVHVNRTLQRLRSEGLIRLCHRRLMILDFERLAALAAFDGSYLRVRQCRG